ncbi:MAG: carbohydrate porin [Geothrix sp.]|uniref:carbohydrate porin n=1 Tax=Geothrix sp. TaxID=1962974 RepID=UPI001803E04D|nr:carbohydrate porin [Geothrix sp.]NWJ42309.1 carbohydrate porin [Geothrix sp.]WIL19723.1 MAG: carbohydrate porin [Geothrix sp.]
MRNQWVLVLALAVLRVPLGGQTPDPVGELWSLHGQATTVSQTHGEFSSPYQGPNSLRPGKEWATSFTTTLMAGLRPWQGTEVYLDLEGAAGKGVSGVLGLAGAPNGETYRVGSPDFRAAVARFMVRQTFDLGGEAQTVEADAHQLGGTRASRRLVIHLGKFSVMDVFDANAYAHDPRSQFLNWTLMGHGAWDYPADTRGYTWGCAAEIYWDAWALRFGRFAEPLEANQLEMDRGIARAHGDVVEVEHGHTIGGLAGVVRLMAFRNTTRMGDYRQSLAESPTAPDITATRAYGRVKQGWGLNLEQSLTGDLGAFARWSWSDGRTESWAFTEVDRSASAGLALKGSDWGRPQDCVGAAFVQNGLSPDHRDYLAAGGLGFLLGDGRLSYVPERILEAYYALALGRHLTATLDAERIWNPGYNGDRGPVTLYAFRLHAQF